MVPAKKVLIVEDEEILASNLKSYLDKILCDTRIAANGASAIRMAKTFCPDVVVLDFRLPDMNGFETLDAMCDCVEGVAYRYRCVLMTGSVTGDFHSGAEQRGIEHILLKPFPLAELSSIISRMPANGLLVENPGLAPSHTGHASEMNEQRRWSGALKFPIRLLNGIWVLSDRRRRGQHDEDND